MLNMFLILLCNFESIWSLFLVMCEFNHFNQILLSLFNVLNKFSDKFYKIWLK